MCPHIISVLTHIIKVCPHIQSPRKIPAGRKILIASSLCELQPSTLFPGKLCMNPTPLRKYTVLDRKLLSQLPI